MAKQIIVTQNNYGILLETQFIDDAKNPVDLTGYSVTVEFEYLEKCFDVLDATIINAEEGRVGIILEQEHTAEIGLYKTQWSVVDDDENVTAQEDIYYFVKKEVGIEDEKEELGINIDASGIIDKFKEIDEALLEHGKKLTEIVEERLDKIDLHLEQNKSEIDSNKKEIDSKSYHTNTNNITTELPTQIFTTGKYAYQAVGNLTDDNVVINIPSKPTSVYYANLNFENMNKIMISEIVSYDKNTGDLTFGIRRVDGANITNAEKTLYYFVIHN